MRTATRPLTNTPYPRAAPPASAHPARRCSRDKRAPPAPSPANRIATHRPVHRTLDCAGGPRAPSGSSLWDCSAAARSRCDRIFAMSCGSSMLAMILSCPPQRAQLSSCTPNTRFSRRAAQLIATCRGGDALAASAPDTSGCGAPRPRCAGVTADVATVSQDESVP